MGTDKAALMVDGAPLLDLVLVRLRTVTDPLIVASGRVPIARSGCVAVTDSTPGSGPLAGIAAALEASPHELCAVVAVDMPECDPALLRALAERWDGEDAVVPVGVRGPEPLHAVYARRALPPLRDFLRSRRLALRDVLGAMHVQLADAGQLGASPRFAMNLNTPADLTSWSRGLPGRA